MSILISSLGFSDTRVGGHAARSMMYKEMCTLVRTLPIAVTKDDFTKAVVEENLLEKPTLSSRKKSIRHLVELYGMDPGKVLFRTLWEFGHADVESLAQLCLICAYARDPQLRYSFELIRTLRPGIVLERSAMEMHLENGFPGRFSPAMKKSMAQNVLTTWTFGGHMLGKVRKTRILPEPRPMSAAYAMFVGYLIGLRGDRLLESMYAALVALDRVQLEASLALASTLGILSFKQAANIVEFDFSNLLTAEEQELIHESH